MVMMMMVVAVIVAAQRTGAHQLIAAVALLESCVSAVAAERVERVVLGQLQIVAADRVHAVAGNWFEYCISYLGKSTILNVPSYFELFKLCRYFNVDENG